MAVASAASAAASGGKSARKKVKKARKPLHIAPPKMVPPPMRARVCMF